MHVQNPMQSKAEWDEAHSQLGVADQLAAALTFLIERLQLLSEILAGARSLKREIEQVAIPVLAEQFNVELGEQQRRAARPEERQQEAASQRSGPDADYDDDVDDETPTPPQPVQPQRQQQQRPQPVQAQRPGKGLPGLPGKGAKK